MKRIGGNLPQKNEKRAFPLFALLLFAAALAFSLLTLILAPAGFRLAAWGPELLFLLFAAASAVRIFSQYGVHSQKNICLLSLLFLVLFGCAIAAYLLFAKPGAGVITVYAVLLLGGAVLQGICVNRQRRMKLMQIALNNSAKAGDMKLALGEDGIRQLLPYFRLQMSGGSSIAKLLILDLIRGVEFEGKDSLVKEAFASGSLEVRIAVVDQIFEWNLPYELLPEAVENCDAPLAEYLVRKIFLNLGDISDHGFLESVRARADGLKRFSLTQEAQRMFAYVFDGRREEYETILSNLLSSDRKEDRLFAARIMAAFIGREDAVNRRHLAEVLDKTVLNPSEAEEMIELCAEYDQDKSYLKQYLSGYYSYSFLKKVCQYYEPASIVRAFGESVYPVPMALTLFAACRMEKGTLSAYRAKRDRLTEYLTLLGREERSIQAGQRRAAKLLLDEIARLKRSLTAVLIEYLLMDETGSRAELVFPDLERLLAEGRTEDILVRLPCDSAERLRRIFTEEAGATGAFEYGVLKLSESNTLLEAIYRHLGGERMDTVLTENIEKLIALKEIPLFSELDVFTLQQIQKISAYQKIPAGKTIITEGEEGDSLYVVIRGRVGVYKGETKVNEIGAGGLLGEMAVIEKQKRSATIQTLEETDFLVIQGDDFAALLERNSSISGSVIRMLSGRLRKMLEER